MDMMGEVKSTRTDIPEIIFGEQIRDRTVNLVAESGQVSVTMRLTLSEIVLAAIIS